MDISLIHIYIYTFTIIRMVQNQEERDTKCYRNCLPHHERTCVDAHYVLIHVLQFGCTAMSYNVLSIVCARY